MNIEKEFSVKVQEHLHGLTASIKPVLKELIEYNYPKEVVSLEFEIFADGFTQGFPVRAFFMDAGNSEHFVYVNGEAQYPSPVEPELLEIENVYSYELEEKYINEDEDFDPWSIAIDELIKWFSQCWKAVGGESFKLKANIAPHDNNQAYNLVDSKWEQG
ncbi:hypothetical protein [Psychrobacter alimentarius]|uniref:hypothetical protein n=1 Tax=Psychrobacter alimentarius TaxID=261164 RepID=UPI001919EEF2|nr:hypothetical protein [Psychrobacter alimentarius]